jgi:hypothetical protein
MNMQIINVAIPIATFRHTYAIQKKKKVQSGIETHNGCNCYAFSVFYLDVVDLGLNTYSLTFRTSSC